MANAAFCAKCGTEFGTASVTGMPPAASPPMFNDPPSAAPPPYYEPIPSPPPRRFKKRYVLYGIVGIFVLLLVVAAASPSSSSNTDVSPTAQASVAATLAKASATVTVKPTSTPKPTPTPTPDASSKITNNPYWKQNGYLVSTPFTKTTVGGKEAYVGAISKMGYTFQVQLFPKTSYSDALSSREQVINSYKAQGYTTYDIATNSGIEGWQGTSGNTMVQVAAYEESVVGGPAIAVFTGSVY